MKKLLLLWNKFCDWLVDPDTPPYPFDDEEGAEMWREGKRQHEEWETARAKVKKHGNKS